MKQIVFITFLIVSCKSYISGQTATDSSRLLVVGGGGARGAWGAGFAHYLERKNSCTYRYVFGTSTGSLMAPMIVLNDFETLKTAYTSVTQDSIFDVNPFDANGNLKTTRAVWRYARKKKTFGESNNLRHLIEKFLTEKRYEEIRSAKPEAEFTVCTINFKNGEVLYKRSGQISNWKEMCNWIWASANEPLFMTFVDEKYLAGGYYVDGGVRANVPVIDALEYALNHRVTNIDIIVNKPIDPILDKSYEPTRIFKNLKRVIELWETQVRDDNMVIASLLNELGRTSPTPDTLTLKDPLFTLSFHFIPPQLYKDNFNELLFNQENMVKLWDAGEAGQEDQSGAFFEIRKSQLNNFLNKYSAALRISR